ncbi:DUF6795 domain-containing protein [Sagittula salina]|uniref:DUF6795 domain-containing protein n=1 Tax=Sagittula salina TaxID=2820268 RepID=A0A940ML74_9RHOB|nr:DUF6795 domain-containing protein [Sagittula salina]MBP0481633.1 hypothetical protein [Sagittula salina]
MSSPAPILRIAALAALLFIGSTSVARAKEYLCSPMTGQLVTPEGAPVPDTPVRRSWFWRGKRGEDSTVTDAEGRFSFGPVHPKRGLFERIPAREAVTQDYFADLPEGPFQFLTLSTRGLALNAETMGRAFNIRCRTLLDPYADDIHFGTCSLIGAEAP